MYNVFLMGFAALTLLISILTVSPILGSYPNLSLLFGLGSVNAGQLVRLPKTSRLWLRAAWALPALSLLTWGTLKFFSGKPLWMGLVLLGPASALIVLLRYFQLAMELDQRGVSQMAKVILSESDPEEPAPIFVSTFRYIYANGIDSGLQIDRDIAIPLEAKTASLRVIYLEDQPLVHRLELEHLPKTETLPSSPKKPSRKDWKARIPRSGAAREIIPRALEEFVRAAPVGGFIVFSHPKKTEAFVQFVMAGDSLTLDFPLIMQQPQSAEADRARQFFAERRLEVATNSVQTFPPGPDRIEQASRLALEIFERAFLMDGETILRAEAGA